VNRSSSLRSSVSLLQCIQLRAAPWSSGYAGSSLPARADIQATRADIHPLVDVHLPFSFDTYL
jgi:hypothetical protein